jgi:hypothetical protein
MVSTENFLGEEIAQVFHALDADLDRLCELSFDALTTQERLRITRSWQFTDAVARDSKGQLTAEVHDAINQILAALGEPRLEDIQPHSPDVNAVNT